MIFTATADGMLDLGDRKVRCALGPAGVKPAAQKREGDGASPAGIWPIREVWYRPDRGAPPHTPCRRAAQPPAYPTRPPHTGQPARKYDAMAPFV